MIDFDRDAETEGFMDELSDEALDRSETTPKSSRCASHLCS